MKNEASGCELTWSDEHFVCNTAHFHKKKKKIPCNPDINGNQCNKEGISPGMKTVIDWNNLFWQGDKGETINCSRTSGRVELEEIILL